MVYIYIYTSTVDTVLYCGTLSRVVGSRTLGSRTRGSHTLSLVLKNDNKTFCSARRLLDTRPSER